MNWTLATIAASLALGTYDMPAGKVQDKSPRASAVQLGEVSPTPPTGQMKSKARTFLFTYEATVTGVEKGQNVKVWIPVAQSNDDQQVNLLSHAVASGVKSASGRFTHERQYGNVLFYVETEADQHGKVNLRLSYRVTRREVRGETGKTTKEDADTIRRFMQPDRLVPIEGKPLELIQGKELPGDPMKKARLLYDVVDDHMRYAKIGNGWGRGDSVWACDSKYGNCTDFHSLFVSLARSQKIPAKFEVGFAIPATRGEGPVAGYHCWAFFRPEGKAWVPVDISEANKDPNMKDYYFGSLTEDRVAFTTGRDLTLEPRQSGNPINFLIYPYVEVDGKEYDATHINMTFAYRDVRS